MWWDHVQVPAQYESMGCDIPDTHARGMTIEMLEDLAALIETVLKSGYQITDRYTHKAVSIESLNLYHVNEHFVMPLTHPSRVGRQPGCSFVELASSSCMPPKFFISHWWGTPLVDTIRMLKLHRREWHKDEIAKARKGSYQPPRKGHYTVWICTFANRQHHLDELSTTNFLETPFARAIMSDLCQGTIIVLNEREATPFQRSWCIFEAYVSITHAIEKTIPETSRGSSQRRRHPHRMDVLTIVPQGENTSKPNPRCAGLLKDLMLSDNPNGFKGAFRNINKMVTDEGNQVEGQVKQDAWFPLQVAMHGVNVDILQARASQEVDQRNIQRWVADKVDEVNQTLRVGFVRPALKAAFFAGNVERIRQIVDQSIVSEQEIVRLTNDMELMTFVFQIDSDKKHTDEHFVQRDIDISYCVHYLLELGCDPNRPHGDMGPAGHPLGHALHARYYECARVLLQFGADASKFTINDLLRINYADCPDDLSERLASKGTVRKGRVMRACYPLFCCLMCCSGFCYLFEHWDAVALGEHQGSLADMFRDIGDVYEEGRREYENSPGF